MRKSTTCIARLIVLGSSLSTFHVKAETIFCPAKVHLNPVAIQAVPEGWSSSQRFDDIAVDGAFISAGKPADLTDLKPETEGNGRHEVSVWRFDESDIQKGLWLSCSYGKWLVLLSQKLPAATSECRGFGPTVDSKGSAVVRVECK